MAKETYIELECKDGRKIFSVEHADGILRMRYHASWRLPEDSEWTWSVEKGFEKKVPQKAQKGSKDGSNGSNRSNGSNGSNGQATE